MATDNKGIMVYLTPDLVDAISQYCLDNGITRKIGDDEAAPSLGTGIAHYLKSTIINTVPVLPKNIVPIQEYNNNVGLSKEEITDLIEQYNNNNIGLTEEKVTDLIEEKITNLPSTFSLQDIDRLIGSAISSVTKANNEVIAELKNIIGHQVAKVDQLSKLVENLAPTANSGDLQPPDKSWVDLNTIAAQLKILPNSISTVASKKGRDIGDDTIEFEVAGQTIYKKGFRNKALYQLCRRVEN